MPWNKGNYPPSMKNLPPDIRGKAVEIANAMLDENADEGIAIATGISRAKDWAQNHGMKVKNGDGRTTDVKVHGHDQYVVPHNGEWAVKNEGEKTIRKFHLKKDAVEAARKKAKQVNGNLVIQGKDGRVQTKTSYNPNKSR
jgi:uncharacterized protein YdaT